MKTLADLKRVLQVGKRLTCIHGPKSGARREVIEVQTNAIVLIDPDSPNMNKLKKNWNGSWLEFPKATLVEVTDKGFKMYMPGIRDLTEDEQKVIANEPRDDKQDEIDLLTDGSIMFHQRKRYYEEAGFGYLYIGDKNRRRYNRDKTKVVDSSVKGDLSLEYIFDN